MPGALFVTGAFLVRRKFPARELAAAVPTTYPALAGDGWNGRDVKGMERRKKREMNGEGEARRGGLSRQILQWMYGGGLVSCGLLVLRARSRQ